METEMIDMDPAFEGELRRVITLIEAGDRHRLDQAVELLYPHLKKKAEYIAREFPNNSMLNATALVNELFLKWANTKSLKVETYKQFINFANHAMYQILWSSWSEKNTDKRLNVGKEADLRSGTIIELSETLIPSEVMKALGRLASVNPVTAAVGKLYIGCQIQDSRFSFKNLGELADISESGARQHWAACREFIKSETGL